MERVVFWLRQYRQLDDECSISACASIANFYNKELNYENIRENVKHKSQGMWAAQQCMLLNSLGFKSVTMITGQTEYFDFSWENKGKRAKINRLKKSLKYCSRLKLEYHKICIQYCIDFLEDKECKNRLVIDWDYAKWIKHCLRNRTPVLINLNITSFHRLPKYGGTKYDDIKGNEMYHAVCLRGYDSTHLFVVDPDWRYYKTKWTDILMNIDSMIFVNQKSSTSLPKPATFSLNGVK